MIENPIRAKISGMTWLSVKPFIIIAFKALFEKVIGVMYAT